MAYRISVTTLEKFRRYLADSTSFDTEQRLVESLQGLFTGSDKTIVGNAFHQAIEKPADMIRYHHQGRWYGLVKVERSDYIIGLPEPVAKAAIAYRAKHPKMFLEVPVGKMYQVAGQEWWVAGRVDGLEGIQVRDAKTKFRSLRSLDEYTDSAQWKFYLDIIGVKCFYYDIFEVVNFEPLNPVAVRMPDGQWLNICFCYDMDMVIHEPYQCIAYDHMQRDIMALLGEFTKWIRFRGHEALLKPCDEKGRY